MKPMSTEMATLLKSKKMIGDNKPVAEVVIGGRTESYFELLESQDGTPLRKNIGPASYSRRNMTNIVPTEDGRFISCWMESGSLKVGYSADESFFHTNYNLTNVLTYSNIANPTTLEQIIPTQGGESINPTLLSLFKRSDGKILLFVNDPLGNASITDRDGICSCLISNSGNGDDFVYYSEVYRLANPGNLSSTDGKNLTMKPIEISTPTGKRLMFIFAFNYIYDSKHWLTQMKVCTSDDNGETWDYRFASGTGMSFFALWAIGQPAQLPSGEVYFEITWSSASVSLYKTSDYGITFQHLGYGWSEPAFGTNGVSNSFMGSWFYYPQNDTLYRISGWVQSDGVHAITNPTVEKVENPLAWEPVTATNNPYYAHFDSRDGYIIDEMPSGDIAFFGTTQSGSTFVLGWTITIESLQAKSITIDRSKGMAGSLTVEFDNKDGVLAPDGETNPALLWPNKEIIVKQGYGTELLTTFTGLIDSIDMSTFPQTISISARDMMKPLLDNLARDAEFNYVLQYMNASVEGIWTHLIGLAGLEIGVVEETGLTISEKTFSWETYADCISWLDDIAGFETYCDEDGKMNFVRDGRPINVVTTYSFVEGVDIIKLGYTINDQDLYYSVAVYGQTPEVEVAEGEEQVERQVIYFARQFPQAEYWNVSSGKVLRIDAPDADTVEKCEIIADKAIYLMQTRARQVSFQTIGIPHLQRGDFIQITETSSTISEIYRITDISTSQENGKYTMDLTCYYHSAPEVI